ncbi:hypothetical protein HS088_TW06G00704 [Tripterygium wilfordii]|uniref:Transducin/WD40 repeat-like superfamily protein n=1 Tax=Tripterygium wilfordii TaxID=458696 RepID=A0A7J7DJP8_TRIWF|nr:protein JINGUBANG [Tripterygium wilfordii]KAF5746533.1 hypothetical protein HS088_TW06G00704 [Tripterygium wilfordii]
MKVRAWLASCSMATATMDSTLKNPPQSSPKHLASDTSSASDNYSTTDTSSSSLQSNFSLQTFPSLPSLQKFSQDEIQFLSVSHACVSTLKTCEKLPITCLAVHEDLLYAASAHEINVYDRSTLTHLNVFNGQESSTGYVKAVTVNCDGKLFTAHQDCKIRVWRVNEAKRYKLLDTLPTINDRLRRCLLPKNYVNVRRHKKRLWIEHGDAVTGLAVRNGLIYSVSWDKCLKIWRASDLRCLESVKAHEDAVNAVVVSVDGTVYTGSADRKIRVWAKPFNQKRHMLMATLEKHKSAVNALALNEDGSVLFSGACDRSILVWGREDSANYMAVTGALRGHEKAILSLINVSGLLFSGSADRTVRIWRRGHDARYCCLSVMEGHQKPVKSLAAVWEDESNDVVSVFSGSLDGEINVWKVSASKPNSPQY